MTAESAAETLPCRNRRGVLECQRRGEIALLTHELSVNPDDPSLIKRGKRLREVCPVFDQILGIEMAANDAIAHVEKAPNLLDDY